MPHPSVLEPLDPAALEDRLRQALREDVGAGDVTSDIAIPEGVWVRGRFVAREGGVLSGMPVVAACFGVVDERCRLMALIEEGATFEAGAELGVVEGPARSVLRGERLALNLLQRMTGIATETRRYVDAVAGTGVEILDTRKTMPLWRDIDKYAVRCGGGANHRMGLWDQVLVKDNHLALSGDSSASLEALVNRYRQEAPGCPIEVEVDGLDQFRKVLETGVEFVLLDNMPPETLREAVRLAAQGSRRPRLEASGGITIETVRAVAATGIDRISVGALTHSVRALDIGLDVEEMDPC